MENRFYFRKLLVSLFIAAGFVAKGQTPVDPAVMTVAGKDVPLSEFVFIANKNGEVNLADSASLHAYVDLFKNFKLKVAEAESQGVDTTTVFLNELDGYKLQLAKNYFPDAKEITENDIRSLKQNFPEFRHLMQEYRDGILLFEVSNQEVWGKASTDKEGLQVFFERNRSKYESMDPELMRGQVIADFQTWLDKEWTDKLVRKYPVKVYWDVLKKLIK